MWCMRIFVCTIVGQWFLGQYLLIPGTSFVVSNQILFRIYVYYISSYNTSIYIYWFSFYVHQIGHSITCQSVEISNWYVSANVSKFNINSHLLLLILKFIRLDIEFNRIDQMHLFHLCSWNGSRDMAVWSLVVI